MVAQRCIDGAAFEAGAWVTMLRRMNLPPFSNAARSPLLVYNIRSILRGDIRGKVPHLLVRVKKIQPGESDVSAVLSGL